MGKKARWVSFLILLGFGSLFSIQLFAEDMGTALGYPPNDYGTISIDELIHAELDQISNAESSGQISPNQAEHLRLEVEAILQQEENTQLHLMQFQRQKLLDALDQTEQDIQSASGH